MSLYFTGYDNPGNRPPSRSHLVVPITSPGFNFGYNNFTIEWWQLLQKNYNIVNQYPHVFMSGYRDGVTNLGVSFENNTMKYWENDSYYSIDLSSSIVTGSWHHFSINRIKSPFNNICITRIFMDGRQIGQLNSFQNINLNYDLIIGNQTENIISQYAFQGYLTNFMIMNGTCLRQIPFNPPLQPLNPTANTVLLLMGTENGKIVGTANGKADFYGTAAPFVDSPYKTISNPNPIYNSNVDHTYILPAYFIPFLPIIVDNTTIISRIKKSTLFSGQQYSDVLRRRNYNTTKIEVPQSWSAGYYIKGEREQNSRNEALRRVRAGGANVPKKVTKNANIFSN